MTRSCDESSRQTQFVSILAHEMRQPLAALHAAVELVRAGADATGTRRAVENMARQIAQMRRLVDDLVDASRLASGKVAIEKQRIDVRDVVADCVQDIRPALRDRRIHLDVAVPRGPLWTAADPQRLQQVLSNLLWNAINHTGATGRVLIGAQRCAGSIRLRVADNGCGIEAHALVHIFDLFSQVRPEAGTGLGVGLSIVREIVHLHAGSIEARSGGLGRGSEFTVTLPTGDRVPRPCPVAAEDSVLAAG